MALVTLLAGQNSELIDGLPPRDKRHLSILLDMAQGYIHQLVVGFVAWEATAIFTTLRNCMCMLSMALVTSMIRTSTPRIPAAKF